MPWNLVWFSFGCSLTIVICGSEHQRSWTRPLNAVYSLLNAIALAGHGFGIW